MTAVGSFEYEYSNDKDDDELIILVIKVQGLVITCII